MSNSIQSGNILLPKNSQSVLSISSNYVQGCTNNLACNYNNLSNLDDGSCNYALENYDCNGDPLTISDDNQIPDSFSIKDIYPNPFNPIISFNLDIHSRVQTKVNIYNINGRLVTTLYDNILFPGSHNFNWDATTMPSGIYLISAETPNLIKTKKITLLK